MVVHIYMFRGVNGVKIQAMGTSNYLIFLQVVLLGVSDHCVKKKTYALSPYIYIYISPYGLYYISFTVLVGVTGYTYLL